MPVYENSLRMGAARDRYFEVAGTDPGYDDRWVRLKLGPIPLAFPNTKERLRAVRLHDLHHVVTGYATSWTGEFEISAWEVAAGCGNYWAAWGLNLSGLFAGFFVAPSRVVAAFFRGRQTTTLYHQVAAFEPGLLDLTVGELRARLHLDRPLARPHPRDWLALGFWAAASLLFSLSAPLALAVLIYAIL
jgi:hypothetical protein